VDLFDFSSPRRGVNVIPCGKLFFHRKPCKVFKPPEKFSKGVFYISDFLLYTGRWDTFVG